jgi:hypothetical protein
MLHGLGSINPSLGSFGDPTSLAPRTALGTVASWLCVPAFRRVCLCRDPHSRGAILPVSCPDKLDLRHPHRQPSIPAHHCKYLHLMPFPRSIQAVSERRADAPRGFHDNFTTPSHIVAQSVRTLLDKCTPIARSVRKSKDLSETAWLPYRNVAGAIAGITSLIP